MGVKEEEPNSMSYWLPKLREMEKVNIPKTKVVVVDKFPEPDIPIAFNKGDVIEAVDHVGGFPVFIRTDKASDKHHMKDVSRVNAQDEFPKKIGRLAKHNSTLGWFGVNYHHLAIREWLEIKHKFRAFAGDMKVGYEIRAFVKDGEIVCKHYYWPKDCIELPNTEDWGELWGETKKETMDRWEEAKSQVEAVAEAFEGGWSVDVAMTEDGVWYVIDMATFGDSFHPPECEHAPEEMGEQYGGEADREG